MNEDGKNQKKQEESILGWPRVWADKAGDGPLPLPGPQDMHRRLLLPGQPPPPLGPGRAAWGEGVQDALPAVAPRLRREAGGNGPSGTRPGTWDADEGAV